jgi:hypothetical protein
LYLRSIERLRHPIWIDRALVATTYDSGYV